MHHAAAAQTTASCPPRLSSPATRLDEPSLPCHFALCTAVLPSVEGLAALEEQRQRVRAVKAQVRWRVGGRAWLAQAHLGCSLQCGPRRFHAPCLGITGTPSTNWTRQLSAQQPVCTPYTHTPTPPHPTTPVSLQVNVIKADRAFLKASKAFNKQARGSGGEQAMAWHARGGALVCSMNHGPVTQRPRGMPASHLSRLVGSSATARAGRLMALLGAAPSLHPGASPIERQPAECAIPAPQLRATHAP